MKNWKTIIIVIQSLGMIVLLLYSIILRTELGKQVSRSVLLNKEAEKEFLKWRKIAEYEKYVAQEEKRKTIEQMKIAEEQRKIAIQQTLIAYENEKEAKKQKRIASELEAKLAKCK